MLCFHCFQIKAISYSVFHVIIFAPILCEMSNKKRFCTWLHNVSNCRKWIDMKLLVSARISSTWKSNAIIDMRLFFCRIRETPETLWERWKFVHRIEGEWPLHKFSTTNFRFRDRRDLIKRFKAILTLNRLCIQNSIKIEWNLKHYGFKLQTKNKLQWNPVL